MSVIPDTDEQGGFSCNGCGECCEHFTFPVSPETIDNHLGHDGDWGFWAIAAEFLELESRLNFGEVEDFYVYTCRFYDKQTRKCTVRLFRPLTCSRFPFYPQGRAGQIYFRCQFNKADRDEIFSYLIGKSDSCYNDKYRIVDGDKSIEA